MDESLECKGYWFLPSNENCQVAGILRFIPNEKITLELIGGFNNNHFGYIFRGQHEKVIWGKTIDGKKITLFNCQTNSKTKFNYAASFPYVEFDCQYFLIGANIEDLYKNYYNGIRIKTTYLDRWFLSGKLNDRYTFNLNKQSIELEKKEIPIDNGYELTLGSNEIIIPDELCNKISYRQETYCEISVLKEKTDLITLLKKTDLFVEFISLASLANSSLQEIELIVDESSGTDQQIRCYIINPKYKNIHFSVNSHYLFQYEQIADIFPSIIKQWYEIDTNFAPIRTYLISSIQKKKYFEVFDYLIIIQALEGYHRRFINSQKLPLKKRLEQLLTKFSEIDKIKELSIDIEAVVQTRDYYSHFFDKNETPLLLENYNLYKLSINLRLLLICCTLKLIGFNNGTINELFNTSTNWELRILY